MRRLVLIAVLLLVAVPRFDYWDPGPIRRFTGGVHALPGGHGIDVEGYIRLVQYFRGAASADSMIAPYAFRPLVPAAAALLPFRPLTAINLLNLLALVGALCVLDASMGRLGIGDRPRWIAGLLFAVSFPTFYYSAIGFVDPVAILAATLLLWLTLCDAPLPLLVAAAVLGALVKETNAAFSVLPGLYGWLRGRRSASDLATAAMPPVAAIVAVLGARLALPFPGNGYVWLPSKAALLDNLSRPRTYVSLLLTAGLPGWLAARAARASLATLSRPERGLLLGGVAIAAGLYLYSVASAYTDGRIIWIADVFLLPLGATWFTRVGPASSRTDPARDVAPAPG